MDSLKAGVILHGKSFDYNIVKTLGQGTFGITYLASVKIKGALEALDSELLVAVKEFFMRDFNGRNESSVTYSSKDGAFAYYKSKFINEANNLSNLQNQGIIKVIELFEENQTAYYVMEYVSNGSLDELIKVKGRLSSEDCVSFSLQIAEALSYMHENKMLHLDLKPNNIMVRKDNQLVLIDFGLSKRFDAYGKPETSTTIGHGTPGYAPVEQANYQGTDNGEFPATMDIYALGGTMFKMLTGHRPPEASVILNEGFPISELENIGVAKQLSDIVARCMEPRRKNRYKTTVEVIDVLSKLDIFSQEEETEIQNGHYKRKSGEREYGTFKIEKIPVTSAFEFPQYINIKLWDNSQKGKSYEVIMTDGHFEDGYYSLMRIWDKGVLVDEHEFQTGIPKDVKKFLTTRGFLSTEHWEDENETTPIADDFGTDASITMVQGNGERFVRRVSHAHVSYHNLLLDELVELLNTTSLAKELNPDKNKRIHTEIFEVPLDTYEISVSYEPSQIGTWRGDGGYGYSCKEHKVCTYGSNGDVLLDARSFKSLLTEIGNIEIHIGMYKNDTHDYSEVPGRLDIKFNSKKKGLTHLSLVAFNTDMQGGNIYNSNIIDLAVSIQRIILKYLPDCHEPTKELIYSIPESTSEIWIEYNKGGFVGQDNTITRVRLGKIKKSVISSKYKYIYNSREFKDVVDGLRKLKLRSQDRSFEEPSTGIMFPTLTITLYDSEANKIKQFYAQDNGDRIIGDIALPVDCLKDELVKISSSFKKELSNTNNNVKTKTHSWSDVIFFAILVSFGVALFALPLYLFIKPTDALFNWLWLSIGITEISILLFIIFGLKNNGETLGNVGFSGFVIGIVSFVVYVVLWIIQMCKWWV